MMETREDYERPQDARDVEGERSDGRPSNGPDLGSWPGPAPDAPTEAVEEKGGNPSTEHAPGGDL